MEEAKEQVKKLLSALASDDSFFDLAATVLKKFYDALLKHGFTAEQANIIISQLKLK